MRKSGGKVGEMAERRWREGAVRKSRENVAKWQKKGEKVEKQSRLQK